MEEDYKKIVERNNQIILNEKETIKKYYGKDLKVKIYNIDNITDENEIKKIIEEQVDEIAKLHIIVDTEGQKKSFEVRKKIEELKETETDKEFSKFYREGIIEVNNIEVSVSKFYIKELKDKEGKPFYNFICTDKRIDKRVFGTVEDRELEVLNIYKLKDSALFYNMYLDKNIYSNNKIVINDNEKLKTFMDYIHTWTPEKHSMVAETMIK